MLVEKIRPVRSLFHYAAFFKGYGGTVRRYSTEVHTVRRYIQYGQYGDTYSTEVQYSGWVLELVLTEGAREYIAYSTWAV